MAVGILGFLISICSICVFVFVGGSGDHGRDNKGRGCIASHQCVDSQPQRHPFLPCLRYWNVSLLPSGPVLRFILVAQTIKHLPAMCETQVRSLGWEDPLEKEMATHSSTLAWKIPWMEEPCRLQSMGSQRVRHD